METLKNVIIGIISVVFMLFGLLIFIVGITSETPDMSAIITGTILLALGLFILIKRTKSVNDLNVNLKDFQEDNYCVKEKYFHIEGLNLPIKTPCTLSSLKNEYRIIGNGVEFGIAREKLIDVSIRKDVDVAKQYVSSTGGAVGGFMLAGGIGAAIGGRAKVKQIKDIKKYLVITYCNADSEDVKYVLLGLKANQNINKTKQIVADFMKNKVETSNKKIHL